MRKYPLTLVVVLMFLPVHRAQAQFTPGGFANLIFGYKVCDGPFALCAASTCTPTDHTIEVNVIGGTKASFPEAACKCPVFDGRAIADVLGGNMHGTCNPPGKGQVWSLWAPKEHIPQKINNWSRKPAASAIEMQLCSSSDNVGASFANCFSFACTLDPGKTNGVRTATCFCPMGEDLNGEPVPADTAVTTPAGQCNSDICFQHPVGAPYPAANGEANQCLSSSSSP